MDILSLLLSCSLYPQDDTVQSLVNVLSSGHPYYVTDKAGSVSGMYPKTPEEADQLADKIRAGNGQPLVGLLAVNTATAASFNASQASLFDACKNIEVGTAILSAFAEACKRDGDKDPKICAVSRYADNIGISPKLLQDAVTANIEAMHERSSKSDDVQDDIPAPERSSVFADGMTDDSGAQQETRSNAVFIPVEGENSDSTIVVESQDKSAGKNTNTSAEKCNRAQNKMPETAC